MRHHTIYKSLVQPTRAPAFVGRVVAGRRFGLPVARLPVQAMSTSYVAVLGLAPVFAVFKRDVRLT